MHRRKTFIVYPPNYKPGDGFKEFKSLRQAKKRAYHLGSGTEICVNIFEHPGKFTRWNSSSLNYVGEIV